MVGLHMSKIKEFLGLGYYTSELDQFLRQYREAHPQLSASQQQEKEKSNHIALLRDHAIEQPTLPYIFWDKF